MQRLIDGVHDPLFPGVEEAPEPVVLGRLKDLLVTPQDRLR